MLELIERVMQLRHSPLHNYIVPGLTSWIVGPAPNRCDDGQRGCLRLFEMTRRQDTQITPHSHRFDFTCLVLQGKVRNTLFYDGGPASDEYVQRVVRYTGKPGDYETESEDSMPYRYGSDTKTYYAGDTYSMKTREIHSIEFESGALVLFFEGPTVADTSCMLLPWANGCVIDTSTVQPWMFRKEGT